MTTTPFRRGETAWYGEWIAGEFYRIKKCSIIVEANETVGVKMEGDRFGRMVWIENLERIHNDLNERLK